MIEDAMINQKARWNTIEDDLILECICPALKEATDALIMSGYWTTGIIAELSAGLATLLSNNNHKSLRILIAPLLEEEDKKEIEEYSDCSTIGRWLENLFFDTNGLEAALRAHTRACVSKLIQENMIEIRVVELSRGIFHKKDYIINNGTLESVLLSGSANATRNGLGNRGNSETVNLFRSWGDNREKQTIAEAIEEFDAIWNNKKHNHKSTPLPKAIKDMLVSTYNAEDILSEPRCREEIERLNHQFLLDSQDSILMQDSCLDALRIPNQVNWETGVYGYQKDAVDRWMENNCKGTLKMCTGAGKTKTAMIIGCLMSRQLKIAVVIAAPTNILIDQWQSEVEYFGIHPFAFTDVSGKQRRLIRLRNELIALGDNSIQNTAVIITHDALLDEDYMALIRKHKDSILLIADEAHGLTPRSLDMIPSCKGMLALSATPERFDTSETDRLYQKFGPVVFTLELDDLIGKTLVPYTYILSECQLDTEEYNSYLELTAKLSRLPKNSDKPEIQNLRKNLIRRRRMIYECTDAKMRAWEHQIKVLLAKNEFPLSHTLVYTSQKDATQIQRVNDYLSQSGVRVAQITCDEGQAERDRIIEAFGSGNIAVLTSKRILDEGVNIPAIQTAFLIASQTTPREWIQRRGRCLRQSPGKEKATLYDYIVTPPSFVNDNEAALRFLQSEITRCESFIASALNDLNKMKADELLRDVLLRYN